jgi:hypothetical protein
LALGGEPDALKIVACNYCPNVRRPSAGVAVCGITGRPTSEHAGAAECPHPDGSRFTGEPTPTPTRRPGPGDAMAGLIKLVTLGRVAPCGACGSRRQKMNAWGWRGCLLHPLRLAKLFLVTRGGDGTDTTPSTPAWATPASRWARRSKPGNGGD